MSEQYEAPKPGLDDHLSATARGVLGAIPFGGALATELFNAIVGPPLERRREAWRKRIGEALQRLESRVDNLVNDDVFIDALLNASHVAMRTHEAEKLEALRNAVLNAAAPHPPDKTKQQVFLQLVDAFTVWHLRILQLLDDPAPHVPNLLTGGLEHVLLNRYPELDGQRELYDLCFADLRARRLVNTDSLHGTMSANGLKSRRTTELGQEFLQFIAEPREESM